MEINRELAAKVLSVVDKGLSSGLGTRKPGQMCVEAAVCYAMGLPHGDDPNCVSPAVRAFKIALNDAKWSSKAARAKGMRRLAIIQLGTADTLDDKEFARRLGMLACTVIAPRALRAAAAMDLPGDHGAALEQAAKDCEAAGDLTAANAAAKAAAKAAEYAADAAADAARAAANAAAKAAEYAAADYAARAARAVAYAAADAAADVARAAADVADAELSFVAEEVVKILVDMGVPGAAWLDLAPL